MSAILAIDPGSGRSALVELTGDVVTYHVIQSNDWVLGYLRRQCFATEDPPTFVIEDIEPRQQPLGREVADTLRWIGRFMEAVHPLPVYLLTRRAVTAHHIDGGTKNADSRIRAALIDRWGTGSERKGGPLAGITKDCWQALAVAVTFQDTQGGANP